MAYPRLLLFQEVALNSYIFKKYELDLVCYNEKEKEENILRGGNWEKLQGGLGWV